MELLRFKELEVRAWECAFVQQFRRPCADRVVSYEKREYDLLYCYISAACCIFASCGLEPMALTTSGSTLPLCIPAKPFTRLLIPAKASDLEYVTNFWSELAPPTSISSLSSSHTELALYTSYIAPSAWIVCRLSCLNERIAVHHSPCM